jgi:hypothetical protein
MGGIYEVRHGDGQVPQCTQQTGFKKNGVFWDVTPGIPEDAILHSHRRENVKSYRFQEDLKDEKGSEDTQALWRLHKSVFI